MFQSLRIKNVQSHTETVIDFSNGINVIIGQSDSGKTAVLRALCWLVYNRPLGIDTLANHGIRGNKGQLLDDMSVELITERGSVKRIKSAKFNGYILNGIELAAVKTDVPAQVQEFLNLTDINFQWQQDTPFMLSSTAGEVGKVFNGIVKLDKIDTVLSICESKKRKENQELVALKEQEARIEQQLSRLSFTEKATRTLKFLDKVLDEQAKMLKAYELLSSFIAQREQLSVPCLVDKAVTFETTALTLEGINKEKTWIILKRKNQLVGYIDRLKDNQRSFPDTKKQEELLAELALVKNQLGQVKPSLQRLKELSKKAFELATINAKAQLEIGLLTSQLPEICPACGQHIGDK